MTDALGRYILQERVGWRGEAELWRAGRKGSPRSLVMIELLEAKGDQGKVWRFVERARRAASITHENVAQVIELGTRPDGAVFVVKEHVHGPSLRRLVSQANKMQSRLPPWLAVYVVRRIVGALADIYQTPGGGFVVHSDLRPSTIVVAFDGRVKLSDFGAEAAPSRRPKSESQEAEDRLGYRSWSRIQAEEPKHADDVYAAAVVLWEALTQRKMIPPGTPEERINMIRQGPAYPPSHFYGDIPTELDALVLGSILSEGGTAVDMAQALDQVLLHLGGRPGPGGVAEVVTSLMGTPAESLSSPVWPPTSTSDDLLLSEKTQPITFVTEELVRPEDPELPPPQGLYLRSSGGVQIGPRNLPEILSLFVELAASQARSTLELSVDQGRWFGADRLESVFGELMVPDTPNLPVCSLQGTFREESATAVLSEVARRRGTGRLVFVRYETATPDRTDIVFESGLARSVASNRHLLFGHRCLLERGREIPQGVQAAVEFALKTPETLDELAPRSMRSWLAALRSEAVETTMTEIMGWPWARFAFIEGPVNVPPAAPAVNVFQGLLGWLRKGKEVPVMQAYLAQRGSARWDWTSRYPVEKDSLALDEAGRERMQRFGGGRTLGDALADCRDFRDEQDTLRMAYLLLELGWLAA